MRLKIVLCSICCSLFLMLFPGKVKAQQEIRGKVKDKRSGEVMIGASVSIKGQTGGVVTGLDGSFSLRVDGSPPYVLMVSFLGYENSEITVSDLSKPVTISLKENVRELKTAEIKDSRITEKQKQAPLTIETMDAIAVKETPAANFYEGLAHLKGVDLTSASIGFKIINTRGFNSTSPVRSLQLIDGVDNQSPGLNFSLGNFLGAPELDIQRVDLVVGASGAYYGPNAFNGVINMQTKSPFQYPGLSAQVKVGERNLLETSVRWAQVFKNKGGKDKWAYKVNLFYMHANDWEATNYDTTSQSPTGIKNPGGYDAVNRYGDEYSSPKLHSQLSNLTYVGFGYYLREGFEEQDLVDYKSNNLKLTGAIHYKPGRGTELIYGSNYGTGTTVYQGDNRFSLRDIQFFQNKLEFRKENRFFIRIYETHENAGNSYDAYNTALILQNSVKSDYNWGYDYSDYLTANLSPKVNAWYQQNYHWLKEIPAANNERLNYINKYWYENFADLLNTIHAGARQNANTKYNPSYLSLPALVPGTARFDSALNYVRSHSNRQGGSRFIDRSALYHVAGEYKFKFYTLDFTSGGNFRLYAPYSEGTIFLDSIERIYNREFGLYIGAERKLLDEKLKVSATCRLDKNENFPYLISPAATAVYTYKTRHVFRLSLASALRNPTLTDQYIHLNVGRATLLGNLHGLKNVATIASFITALDHYNKDSLKYFDIDPVRPEQVKTIEIGYRGNALKDKLYFDISAYHSWYTHFIGYKIAAVVDWPPANIPTYTVYRVATNSKDQVTTKGITAGVNYFMRKYLGFALNYSWNKLDRGNSTDSIIPAYNTPEHKYNIGINGRDIETHIGSISLRHWGYSINYKYQSGFVFEGSPQFTGYVPAYDMVDAQINKSFPAWHCTIKLGASNLLNNNVYQVYGGPRVGRLAYVSISFDLISWR